MTKRTSLADALSRANGDTKPSQPSQPAVEPPKPTQTVPSSRKGKKVVAGHFDRAVSIQLKRLALDKDSNVQALLGEAINDLFSKYDLPPIA